MSDPQQNPYAAPVEADEALGVNSGTMADLKAVATYQRGVLVCLLVQIVLIIGSGALVDLAPPIPTVAAYSILIAALSGAVFVFLLATKVYKGALGIVVGILSLLPCINVLILVMVNGKATSVLKQNGIKVGLMGAKNF